jgi:hypothetical protein
MTSSTGTWGSRGEIFFGGLELDVEEQPGERPARRTGSRSERSDRPTRGRRGRIDELVECDLCPKPFDLSPLKDPRHPADQSVEFHAAIGKDKSRDVQIFEGPERADAP